MTDILLSAREFEALAERVTSDYVVVTDHDYAITLEPIRFAISRRAWERHLIGKLLARFAAGWKGGLREPTRVKLQACMTALADTERASSRDSTEGGDRVRT